MSRFLASRFFHYIDNFDIVNELYDEVITENNDIKEYGELNENNVEIHQSIKGNQKELLKGLNPIHDYILDTRYEKYEPNERMQEKMVSMTPF